MKKALLIISITLLILVGCQTSKYPKHYPKMTVEYNGEQFETGVNEVNWAESHIKGQLIGSSQISTSEDEIAKDMDYIIVHTNDVINFKLDYDKDISKISARSLDYLDLKSERTPIEIVNNSLKAPQEKGEYIYSINVVWDATNVSSHNVNYVFRLKVV